MTIAFFSNFLNHHQAFIAEELYKATGGSYTFVETMAMPDWIAKSGYPDFSSKPYLLQAWKDEKTMERARHLAIDAEVALFAGFEVLEFEKLRLSRSDKITFDVSERWLKRGLFNVLSPRILKLYWAYIIGGWSKKPVYKLCSSAYTAKDQITLFTYKDKCYRWGYFTSVPNIDLHSDDIFMQYEKDATATIHIMWCARFLWWKHPELPIHLASRLKSDGYNFHIDLFGSGDKLVEMKELAASLDVTDVVSFCGNKPNAEILDEMKRHQIFLFTSDRNEGWGAVCNEAMSQGCAVVGGHEIGSVPFLIVDGVDGLIFKSCSIDSLYAKVKGLLDNPMLIAEIRKNAVNKMQTIWSPKVAAQNLLTLIDDLQNGRDTSIKEGPCSKAY